MTKSPPTQGETHLIWSHPFADLARTLEREAAIARSIVGATTEVTLLERTAARIEEALRAAAAPMWLPLHDAARLLDVEPDTLRARCRRRLEAEGLARKEGNDWLVSARVVTAGTEP